VRLVTYWPAVAWPCALRLGGGGFCRVGLVLLSGTNIDTPCKTPWLSLSLLLCRCPSTAVGSCLPTYQRLQRSVPWTYHPRPQVSIGACNICLLERDEGSHPAHSFSFLCVSAMPTQSTHNGAMGGRKAQGTGCHHVSHVSDACTHCCPDSAANCFEPCQLTCWVLSVVCMLCLAGAMR
jgi:hypothetical protein